MTPFPDHEHEAIARRAGWIAHDLNNVILSLRGYGELALRRLERGDTEVKNDIAEMLEATDRAAALTHDLLLLGRRQPPTQEELDEGAAA
jgi:signal transduction histidine kinase